MGWSFFGWKTQLLRFPCIDAQVVATSKSGMGASTNQVVKGTSDWVTYRTRVVSVANQVNLDYEDAKPIIEAQLAKTVGGIF